MNPVFEKWRAKESKDKLFAKKILSFGLINKEAEINYAFSRSMFFTGNKVIAEIGVGTNLINEYTVTAIAESLGNMLDDQKLDSKQIFFGNDQSFHGKLYTSIMSRVLDKKGYLINTIKDAEKVPSITHKTITEKYKIPVRVYIGKYKNVKNSIQIAFYWGDGENFNATDITKISMKLNEVNYLMISIPENEINVNYIEAMDECINNSLEFIKRKKGFSKINNNLFAFDISSHEQYSYIKNLHNKLDIKVKYRDNKTNKNWYKSNLNQLNSLNMKYWFRKNDANFAINRSGSGVCVSIKHKHLYKYLKPDQISAIYLHFLVNDDPDFDKSNLINAFVARSFNSSSLLDVVAKKYNIKTLVFHNHSSLYKQLKDNNNLLIAHTNNFEYMLNSSNYIFDAYLFSAELMRMISVYKEKGLTLFDILNKIYSEYGYSHTQTKSYEMPKKSIGSFINRLKNTTHVGEQKLVNYKLIKDHAIESNIYLKLCFEQGDNSVITYNSLDEKMTIFTDVKIRKTDEDGKLGVIIRENNMLDSILELKETSSTTKLNAFSVLKYVFFVLILFGIFAFLFHSVYNFKSSNSVGSANIKEIFNGMWTQINTSVYSRASFIAIIGGFLIYSFTNAMIFKKLLKWQNINVKFTDLLTGSLISLVSQNVTPKSIGGDIATYWFLRRRNVPRPQLISSIVINTFIWQMSNIFLIVVFLPIGIYFYGNFFSNVKTDKTSLIMLISLILGITIDSVLAIGFLLLALNKKIQNWILNKLINFLEWLPFVSIYDADNKRAKLQYEFYKVRHGLKTVIKKWYKFIELLIWKILPWAYVPLAWFALSTDMLQSPIIGGSYFNMMVGSVLIRNINSISPTPGGTGTNDIISKTIYEFIIKPSSHLDIAARSSLLTSIKGIGEVIIPTLLSAIILLLVFIGERRVDIHNARNKNLKLINNENLNQISETKTKFYKISFSLLTIVLTLIILSFVFVNW
ncbi:flippase-like domain-containing protein [Mycoplasma zalophidermidis]|uniref:lysylphosphatidylglycerol synthase transmembrane domain-containing protein n=1 Tax=Mycoplasma zalophidermidis TaxID=398174 RepID=UPI001C11A7DC|nr:lysylphosphatidylglycerol synthase transmembrane domain-containing protein [Mycoplasma zalophidermidis]MBU4689601.1 flippase-like domain-containing protein [Mycoplasma zalophidermidis]